MLKIIGLKVNIVFFTNNMGSVHRDWKLFITFGQTMQFKLILIEMQKKYLKVYIFFISSNKPIFKKFRTIDFIEILVRFQVSSTWASRPSCFIKLT